MTRWLSLYCVLDNTHISKLFVNMSFSVQLRITNVQPALTIHLSIQYIPIFTAFNLTNSIVDINTYNLNIIVIIQIREVFVNSLHKNQYLFSQLLFHFLLQCNTLLITTFRPQFEVVYSFGVYANYFPLSYAFMFEYTFQVE